MDLVGEPQCLPVSDLFLRSKYADQKVNDLIIRKGFCDDASCRWASKPICVLQWGVLSFGSDRGNKSPQFFCRFTATSGRLLHWIISQVLYVWLLISDQTPLTLAHFLRYLTVQCEQNKNLSARLSVDTDYSRCSMLSLYRSQNKYLPQQLHHHSEYAIQGSKDLVVLHCVLSIHT